MGGVVPFVIAAVASILLTPLAISVARRMSLVDRPGTLKVHDRPVPLAGVAVAEGHRVAFRMRSRAASTYVMWIAGNVSVLIGLAVQHTRPLSGALLIAAATAGAAAIHVRLGTTIREEQR